MSIRYIAITSISNGNYSVNKAVQNMEVYTVIITIIIANYSSANMNLTNLTFSDTYIIFKYFYYIWNTFKIF